MLKWLRDNMILGVFGIGVCLKIVYPYTQWLMIIIPIKWLFHWEYTPFSDIPIETHTLSVF